jgi:ABC-type arginine transport system permease subunit
MSIELAILTFFIGVLLGVMFAEAYMVDHKGGDDKGKWHH